MVFETLPRFFGVSSKEETTRTRKRQVWQGISPGFQVVERGECSEGIILGRREQVEDMELWLFGAFDKNIQLPVSSYLQSNIFGNKLDKAHIERNAVATMKKFRLITKEAAREEEEEEAAGGGAGGFATALVIDGGKFVSANYGGYRTVVCRDGVAAQAGETHRSSESKKHWSLSGLLPMRCLASEGKKPKRGPKLTVTTQELDTGIEFIVLASDGIWEVMSNQEAVDLVRQVEHAQSAAEVLAEEAINRRSKSTVSCVVIRFY